MDAIDWDRRYSATELIWTAQANQFIVAETHAIAPGRACDMACGEGRNATWLANRGWAVTGADFSGVALSKAAQLAETMLEPDASPIRCGVRPERVLQALRRSGVAIDPARQAAATRAAATARRQRVAAAGSGRAN